jgi:integrase
MGLKKRGGVYWMSYAVTRELAAQYGCPKTIRESARTGDKREAGALYAERKREVKDGTWRPAELGGHGLLVSTYQERWTANRKRQGLKAAARDAELLRQLLAKLGPMPLRLVRRAHVRDAVLEMRRLKSKRGKPYAPGSVRTAYKRLHAMFEEALREELIFTNPCTLRAEANELPPNVDADPRWRAGAIYTREEVERLISSERVPTYRRVLWALVFYGGMRIGEAAARIWADYDMQAQPLGRLLVATQHDDDALKMDGKVREVPVHVVLAKVLADWKLRGYALFHGSKPEPSDLICRNSLGNRWTVDAAWSAMQRDLKKLGVRPRRVHDLRRTFISLARADGANKDLLRWVTHGPSGDIMDLYTSPEWASLCEQVSKLRVGLRGGENVMQLAPRGAQIAPQRRTS